MDKEDVSFEELELDEDQIKHMIKSRRKEIKKIFKKYSCPVHKHLAKLKSVGRINGSFTIDFATCCNNHRDFLQNKVNS